MTEAAIRAAHRFVGAEQASGHATICRCSCGATWHDADLDCPAMEAEIDAMHDGAPVHAVE